MEKLTLDTFDYQSATFEGGGGDGPGTTRFASVTAHLGAELTASGKGSIVGVWMSREDVERLRDWCIGLVGESNP